MFLYRDCAYLPYCYRDERACEPFRKFNPTEFSGEICVIGVIETDGSEHVHVIFFCFFVFFYEKNHNTRTEEIPVELLIAAVFLFRTYSPVGAVATRAVNSRCLSHEVGNCKRAYPKMFREQSNRCTVFLLSIMPNNYHLYR